LGSFGSSITVSHVLLPLPLADNVLFWSLSRISKPAVESEFLVDIVHELLFSEGNLASSSAARGDSEPSLVESNGSFVAEMYAFVCFCEVRRCKILVGMGGLL